MELPAYPARVARSTDWLPRITPIPTKTKRTYLHNLTSTPKLFRIYNSATMLTHLDYMS